jgi:hypothetical protein
MAHGAALLWARLSEYTDLLDERRRMPIPRRRHKDAPRLALASRAPEPQGIAKLLAAGLRAPELAGLRFEPFHAARFAARITPVLRDVLGCLGPGVAELDEVLVCDERPAGGALTARVRYRLDGRVLEAGIELDRN